MVWLPKEVWSGRKLDGFAPGFAADAALRLFCTPALSQWRHPDQRVLAERARYYLRNAIWKRVATPVGDIATYRLNPDGDSRGSILLIHGWTSEASFMTALAEAIRRAGFTACLVDLPAHGLSTGRNTNLMECAASIVALGDALGPFDAIVSHSFGSMTALVAVEGAPPMPGALKGIKGLVLIASPDKLSDITRGFADHWRLSATGLRGLEQRLERIGRRPIGRFAVSRLLTVCDRPALLIHARDDADVPFSTSENIAAHYARAELVPYDGLGHRNVLFASQVARRVVAYLRDL
ncbi:MAG: alpha/beta fold hydrolase [Hyphomicrobiaceae bacterium]|nr:alpha/beta fold hydrolase [Hyphomicrobiaceae bacterium]